ncbi:hypothetical protein L6164_010505 [Bauhinia variegata]|uniref:Uncharacterized protein n=1 Tax=Bauhinia variegata TaxID=167791 RepID=A0ACB9PQ90_BAUVA|nr:hypothetical protein L6164_010505 [Bauhinia variegata]
MIYIIFAAQKVLGLCSSDKCIPSANRSCPHSPMICPKFLSLTYSHYLDVDCLTNVMISGYWVGPDIDDGWGFVEAFIDGMT